MLYIYNLNACLQNQFRAQQLYIHEVKLDVFLYIVFFGNIRFQRSKFLNVSRTSSVILSFLYIVFMEFIV